MKTRIILHNSISLDCSFTGFTPDMKEHFRIVSIYNPDVYMAVSNTAKTGITH